MNPCIVTADSTLYLTFHTTGKQPAKRKKVAANLDIVAQTV